MWGSVLNIFAIWQSDNLIEERAELTISAMWKLMSFILSLLGTEQMIP